MSAAAAHPCSVCDASSSKYKCPQCGAQGATCSLDCSKRHKAVKHHKLNEAAGRANASAVASTSALCAGDGPLTSHLAPPLHLERSNEVIQAPPAHHFNNIGKFVPMNQYNDTNMLEDFEYLQHVGRSITAVGREIVQQGWLRDQQTAQQQVNGTSASAARGNRQPASQAYAKPATQEERNRQAFETWIRRLRLPIMLLPQGMSARVENGSRWKAQSRQLLTTVKIDYRHEKAGSEKKAQEHAIGLGQPSLLQLVPWTRRIGDLVWSDLVKRSDVPTGSDSQSRDKRLHLALDKWHKETVTSDSTTQAPRLRFDMDLCILIPIHSDKLRNESSHKFLDWWQRQIQHGMVKEGGLELDEEKRKAYERARLARWHPERSLDTGLKNETKVAEPHAASAESVAEATPAAETDTAPAGIISSLLLGQLQAAWHPQQSPRAILGDQTTSPVGATDVEALSREALSAVAIQSRATRAFVWVQNNETIEAVMRQLPKGNAIVEFPHLEIWRRNDLESIRKNGDVRIIHLDTAEDAVKDVTAESTLPDQGAKRPAETALEKPMAKRSANEKPISGAGRSMQSSLAALAGIANYASSEDDESEDDKDNDHTAEGSDDGDGATIPIEEHQDAFHDGGEIVDEQSRSSGLADIARALGMAPAQGPTIGNGNELLRSSTFDDEEALDFGDEA